MNFLTIFLFCFSIIVLSNADDSDFTVQDIVEALMPFAEGCDPKPNEDHVKEIVQKIENPQHTSKCFTCCLMLQFELLVENSHQIDKSKTLDMMSSMVSDRKDDLSEIIDECNERNTAINDNCDKCFAHTVCLFELMKERDFDMPELKDE